MRVVLRADATPEIGTGHVMRCWALAEEFAARGWQIGWQGSIGVPWLSAALAGAGWSEQPHVDAKAVSADLVIVDSYTLPLEYRQTLLDRRIPVLAVVDDNHRQLGPGTVWVNPGAPMSIEESPHFLDGPEYVLIRREIRALRRLRRLMGPGAGVTFLLGGTDVARLGPLIQGVDLGEPMYAGPGNGKDSTITWLPGGAELLRRAACSRLVVSAAGVSSWEMLHVGVPLAVVLAADNQQGNYDWMTSQALAWGLGRASALKESLQQLTALPSPIELDGKSPVDGLGAQRVCEVTLSGI